MITLLLFVVGLFDLNSNSDELNNFLNAKLTGYSKIVWEVTSLPIGFKSVDDSRLILDKDGDIKIKGEYLYLPVQVKRNDGRFSNSVVTLKVKLYKNVFTAIKTIQKGEVVKIEDVTITESDVTGLRSESISDFGENKTYRAKFTIKEGTIIEANVVEELPVILIGTVVKAVKETGMIKISFDAKAKDDGKIGDVIRVQRDDGKIFKAKIENKEIVKIIE